MRYRDLEERLLYNSVVNAETGCWDWVGRANNGGYGVLTMRIPGRSNPIPVYAHRKAYEVFMGESIRLGMEIDHTCHNTLCVNPNHLRQIAQLENLDARRGYAACRRRA